MLEQHNILHIAKMLYSLKDPVSFNKIRMGDKCDSGYVLCDDFSGMETAISIGIGGNVSFDLELAEKGIRVFQFDHTVNGPPVNHPNFIFNQAGWFESPVNEPAFNLDSIIRNYKITGNDLLLKFDVEGAEWDNLQRVSIETLKRCRFIIGEFHFFNNILDINFYLAVLNVLSKLSANHTLIHAHANNYGELINAKGVLIPVGIELTYLRNDRTTFDDYRGPLPTSLDYPNNPIKPDLILRV